MFDVSCGFVIRSSVLHLIVSQCYIRRHYLLKQHILLTLNLLHLPVCSTSRHNSFDPENILPENITSHVHITLFIQLMVSNITSVHVLILNNTVAFYYYWPFCLQWWDMKFFISFLFQLLSYNTLNLCDPMSDLVRHYDFPVAEAFLDL
jgi:hypothetical protein